MRCLFAALAALLCACTEPCVKLAEKVCACEPTVTLRDTCEQQAQSEANRIGLKSADNERCEALLKTCDCHALDTPEGKQACGLARAP